MWWVAAAAGVAANIVAEVAAQRCYRAGQRLLGAVLGLSRWPALAAAIVAGVLLARRDSAWTQAWLALAITGGALAAQFLLLAGYAACRFARSGPAVPAGGDSDETGALPGAPTRRRGSQF